MTPRAPSQKQDAQSQSVNYTYNQQGQVATRLWARTYSGSRVSTTYSYASLTGEPTGLTYNDGTPNATYTYDRMGLMLSAQDIYNGSSTETRNFEYDSYQRLITEKNPSYLGSRWLTYTYESGSGGTVPGRASGYTVGVSGSLAQDLTSLYAYDAAGRIGSLQATHAGVSARTFSYSYGSGSSLMTGLAESTTGYSQTRAYESNRDLLNQFTTQFSSTTKSRYDYTFNTLGQRVTAKQSGDAYADLSVPSFYQYAYDSRGEVTAATGYLCVSGSVTNYSQPMPGRIYQFAFDAAGNRTSATCTTNSNLLDLFSSNSLNQISGRDNHSLTVSGTLDSSAKILVNGALADRQGAYWSADVVLSNSSVPAGAAVPLKVGKAGSPDLKQITSTPGVIAPASESLGYDADGNIVSDGRWTYTWDAENRLISMENTSDAKTAAANAGLVGKKIEFRYDSTGRRTSKKVSNWVSGAWSAYSEVRFVYQGWNLVAELDASGNRVRTYAWGLDLAGSLSATGGIGALVQFVDNTGTATAFHPGYDGSGNVTTVMKDDGTIAAAYEYGPFGELLRKDGTYAADNVFRNATKYTDNESGYVYYGMRYYDPRNGRFINRDPMAERGGLNLYGFCGNDAINHTDYLGQSWLSRFLKFTRKATRDVLNVATLGTLRAPINHLYTWGENHQQELTIAAAIVASIVTYGAASEWAATELAGSQLSIGATWSATTVGAISGAVGGAAAGAVSGVIMTGTVKGTLQGAAAGAIMGGIAGYYGKAWTLPRVGVTAVGGGLASEVSGGSFRQGALISGAVALVTYGAIKLREYEWENSNRYVASDGTRPNATGESVGFNGDGHKIGGGRFNPNFPENAQIPSELGGIQGGEGEIFGFKYPPGSIADRTVEAFAGVHDALNHAWWYDSMGNIIMRSNMSSLQYAAGTVMNWVDVALATPVVLTSVVGVTPSLQAAYFAANQRP